MVDINVSDSVHAGSKTRDITLNVSLNLQVVPALLGDGNGIDFADYERKDFFRKRRHSESASGPLLHVSDLTLVYIKNDAIGITRRDLEEHFPSLYRSTYRSTHVTRDDHTVKWCYQSCSRDLQIDQLYPSFRVSCSRFSDTALRTVAFAKSTFILIQALLVFGDPTQTFQHKIPIIEVDNQLPLFYEVTDAYWYILDISVKYCDHCTLNLTLDHGISSDVVV